MSEEKKPAEDRAKKVLGGKKKSGKSKTKGKKSVHEMNIRRLADDKFLVKHIHKSEPGEMPEPDEEHAVDSPEELGQHVQAHMSEPMPEPTPQAAPQAAPPMSPLG